jgi:SAM-dependent methyltransferase
MSDEVRSNSRPTPPDTGGLIIDPVDGPKSLDIDFPTPDIDLADSGPIVVPMGVESEVSDLAPARAERPPPPSQRMPTQQRLEAMPTPMPRSPSETRTLPAPSGAVPLPAPSGAVPLPAPSGAVTLPPPAPVLGDPTVAAAFAAAPPAQAPPPPGSSPIASPSPAARVPSAFDAGAPPPGDAHLLESPTPAATPAEPSASGEPFRFATETAPLPRRLSEPLSVVKPAGGASASKTTLRPGLVEPKRIIEVLGSNVPVLDSALEEDAIEDLDESEAHEVSEIPTAQGLPIAVDTELEVQVVVEDFPPSVEVPVEGVAAQPDPDEDALGAAVGPGAALDGAPEASLDGPDSPNRRVKAPPNKRRRPPPPSSRSQELRRVEPPAPPGARKWWEEMFSEEFLRAIPILSPRQLEREIDFIDEALAVARGGRILDLACGAGQHAVELAARGYDMVGFDLSQSQLDWAGGLAQERNQRLQFTYGDMRELSYNEAFDAVYSWNTSFGFFEEDKNVDVAERVFRALRPGGRFLLDVVNRDFVVAQQPGQTWFEGDGCVCIDDVSIDFITSRMKVKRTLMLTNGKNRECNYSLRIYGLHELGKILHDVGFKILNVSGRPEMPSVFFGSTSPRIIILAVKP